ncbi:pilus assembly protein PilP [Massilia sp. CCM 9210]|uniref:pilus assembly protein PilP n=1 Tax=Massilia scottii TaxID=3057166 RepID=UPI0027964432|nr:pilus assembly protein PilP [Massilia sp. CCM 9210]MDQ1814655.1 pilus assembly protein PilP [Massilia sp. CCM 9210]
MNCTRNSLALLICAGLLAGCGDSDVQEVNAWMEQTKKETKVDVPPLTEPKTFVPFAYSTAGEIDPYDPNKLLAELARAANGANNPLKPDESRRKEPLEAFPLDTMSMVGSMKSKGVTYALVQIDKTMYHVKPGDRVGQNFGIITGVNDEAISIKETVQDAGGEWIERPTKLELQESKEKK